MLLKLLHFINIFLQSLYKNVPRVKLGLPHKRLSIMKTIYCFFLVLIAGLLTNFSYKRTNSTSYKVDTKQSKILWTGYYLFSFGEHRGSIEISAGEIQIDNQHITGGYFDIDMRSIKDLDMPTEDGGKDLENHLMSDDFFAVDKFQTARFEITKTEKIKDAAPGNPNYDVTGDLFIKGVKNNLTFPALITFKENSVEAMTKFKFDRTKWNIHYNSGKFFSDVGDGAISDAIALEINLIASK